MAPCQAAIIRLITDWRALVTAGLTDAILGQVPSISRLGFLPCNVRHEPCINLQVASQTAT